MQRRSDIDALRAISVLLIIFFHLEIPFFQGGYIGVDVFFVISGYLISKILISELKASGKVSLSRFYIRRVKRLMPALITTLFVCMGLSLLIIPVYKLTPFLNSLVFSTLSLSNIYFYSVSGYFALESLSQPLLHTWSLGVEEQFYLVWPALIIFLARKKRLAILLASLGLVSLIASEFLLKVNSSIAFFMMPFRIYEFAIGAMITIIPRCQNRILSLKILYGLALIIILLSGHYFSSSTPFPGFYALIPCVSAAVCIYLGEQNSINLVSKNKALILIGLISYSLYLVHWPIIVFAHFLFGQTIFNPLCILLLGLISLIAGFILFKYVESPYRNIEVSNYNVLRSLFLSVTFLLSAAILIVQNTSNEFRPWISSGMPPEAILRGKSDRYKTLNKLCEIKGWNNCNDLVMGRPNVLIIGDSHAVDALNALYAITSDVNFVLLTTAGGCPPHMNIESILSAGHQERSKCIEVNNLRKNPEYLKKFDLIVINNHMNNWYKPIYLSDYLSFLQKNSVKNVIVFGNYLTLQKEMNELLIKFGFDSDKIRANALDDSMLDSQMEKIVKDNGYIFLSKRKLLCKENDCPIFTDKNTPFTYDEHHLSYEFSTRLLKDEAAFIAKLISPKN